MSPSDEAPLFELIRRAHPIARKEHCCSFCQQPIFSGERHRLTIFRQDGQFMVERQHDPCPEYLKIIAGG